LRVDAAHEAPTRAWVHSPCGRSGETSLASPGADRRWRLTITLRAQARPFAPFAVRPATTGTDVLTWTTVTCAPNALVATVVGVTLPDCWSYEAAGALVT